MTERQPSSLTQSQGGVPEARDRPEDDPAWVISVYNRHRLREVEQELDRDLGEGRGPEFYMEQVLLDVNPVNHRQSLQEQIFPNPRAVHEDLLDVNKAKLLLEAPAGMGKTTWMKVYQESRLKGPTPPAYPLTVYLDLAVLPQGTGFAEFYPMFFRHAARMVLKEKQEVPGLEIDEGRLQRTLERLVLTGQVMFLLDGIDRLAPTDRFQFFYDVVIDGDTLRDNLVLLAMRPVGFGPMATTSLIKRGQDACFRLAFQKIDSKTCKRYLGELGVVPAIDNLRLNYPEMFETPLLLRMLRTVAEAGRVREFENRTQFFQIWQELVLPSEEETAESLDTRAIIQRMENLAYELVLEDQLQRYQDEETGYEVERLKGEPSLENHGALLWMLDPLLKQTQQRWEFRHPLLQEFYAARRLARDPEWPEILRQRSRDNRWLEIVGFFMGCQNEEAVNRGYDILLDTGALIMAGKVLLEAPGLTEDRRLLVGQLLKYQDREQFPQFSRNRLVQVPQVLERLGPDRVREHVRRLLGRETREPRILYSVLEMAANLNGLDWQEIIDTQDFSTLLECEELKAFLTEKNNPELVDQEIFKRWTECVTVPKGKFIYQNERDDEDRIFLREFAIMKYLATNALWKQFDPRAELRYARYSFRDEQPVVGINYFEATAFALWLGLRLPTEKEWEKAGRGVDGREYPWGEALGYQAGYTNTADFVLSRTNIVEDFEEGTSPYGCYDMAGNVWEWCVQLYSSKFSTQKIVRGGSWLNYLVHAKCTFRNSFDPAEHHPAVGLRCVTLPLAECEEDDWDQE